MNNPTGCTQMKRQKLDTEITLKLSLMLLQTETVLHTTEIFRAPSLKQMMENVSFLLVSSAGDAKHVRDFQISRSCKTDD